MNGALDHFPEEEESATSDLFVDLNAEPMEPMELCDAVFTPAQLAAIQDTVSSTVQAVFQSLPHNDVIPPAPAFSSTPSPRVPSVVSPNGLNRPLDKTLEDKILRGEYVDFSLLLPETLYQIQSPPYNCVMRTRPQAAWAPRLLLSNARNQLYTLSTSGWTRLWCIC